MLLIFVANSNCYLYLDLNLKDFLIIGLELDDGDLVTAEKFLEFFFLVLDDQNTELKYLATSIFFNFTQFQAVD